MHALHSLAHRAPPATRTRVRWQPYNSISNSSCSSRSPSTILNTPSSVTPSPLLVTPSTEFDRIRPTPISSTTQVLKENNVRDPIRNKYTIGLVDQAVKSLCEIWRPQDIPVVFLTPPRGMVGTSLEPPLLMEQKQHQPHRNTQLPSPVSPSTQSPPLSLTNPPVSIQQALPTTFQDATTLGGPRSNLVPIKGFVHEVLRRSRTSGCVLQTALCYLEAIRSKVPELVNLERAGHSTSGEPVWADRIALATDAELALEAEFDMCSDPDPMEKTEKCADEDSIDTIRISNDSPYHYSSPFSTQERPAQKNKPVPGSLAPLLPLPSPLLCPRRAFLASLILASKFTQDKCYSNRAWAKLSGLPPREIGRCERALGEALEWRLWVGKLPTPQASSSPTSSSTNRPVVRSHSEPSLFPSTVTQPFLIQGEKMEISVSDVLNRGSLRRCSTLPTDAFTSRLDQGSWCNSHVLTSSSHTQHKSIMPSLHTLSVATYVDQTISSPSPDTPGLSYSPSSTESSSGDRTIQMTTFFDDPMVSFNPNIAGTENWPWLDNADGLITHASTSPSSLSETITKRNSSVPGHYTSLTTTGWDTIQKTKPISYIEPDQLWGGNPVSLLSSQ